MTTDRLAQIRARLSGALPLNGALVSRGGYAMGWDLEGSVCGMRGQFALEIDAEFHAHAPDDVQWLLAEVERLQLELLRCMDNL